MPEVLEVELTRLAFGGRVGLGGLVGRRIIAVERTDALVVGDGVDAAMGEAGIEGISRHGKVLTVDTSGGALGMHFAMTGRLLVDDWSPLGRLSYGSVTDHDRWDRWVARLDDGTRLRFHDPRRLGRIRLELGPDGLGPDVLSLRRRDLTALLAGRRAPLKAVLLDQARLAGLGNLLVDEVLWRAGLDPRQAAGALDAAAVGRLHGTIRRRLPVMLRRGGSHTGALSPAVRAAVGPCPRCGGPLARTVVGGRTTIWCPSHQGVT